MLKLFHILCTVFFWLIYLVANSQMRKRVNMNAIQEQSLKAKMRTVSRARKARLLWVVRRTIWLWARRQLCRPGARAVRHDWYKAPNILRTTSHPPSRTWVSRPVCAATTLVASSDTCCMRWTSSSSHASRLYSWIETWVHETISLTSLIKRIVGYFWFVNWKLSSIKLC